MMTLREKYESTLKASWMKVNDVLTEARLTSAKKSGFLAEKISLPDDFDPKRIRLFWPSEYPWPLTHKWVFPLLSEFQRNFSVSFKSMPAYENAIFIEVEVDGKIYPIAIDAFDKVEINEYCAAQVMVYFKMQYSTEHYSANNVVPGGFIPAYSNIYLYLEQARSLRDQKAYLYDAYGRFGGRFAKDIRGQAVEKLSTQTNFLYQGGIGRVSYKDSLFEVARSKVCVDLPGYGPLCFRLIDYLAVGACIIAYPHKARLPVPLTPGENIIYCKEDLSDLNDLCEFYINNSKEREAIAQSARAYFDAHLSRPRLASYYINTILELI
ncbi:MAG: glycosyltransferase family 1 protein [Cyanobacteria bacterium J069]|nr:MAG: glycosyltransferase family 1 protein [Cyanobacteria bacterium J069]